MRRVWPWLALLLVAAPAFARVGGGDGYSTGSRSTSGGGGGGSGGGDALLGDLIYLLLRLTISYPQFMIPFWIAVIVVVFYVRANGGGVPYAVLEGQAPTRRRARAKVTDVIVADDPSFSLPVLEDFVQLVWRRAWAAPGRASELLAPFIAPSAATQLQALAQGAEQIEDCVIGALRIDQISPGPTHFSVDVHISATRVEHRSGRNEQVYVEESWRFQRPRGVRSPAPEVVHRLGCPACGVAAVTDTLGRCTSCQTPIAQGEHTWRATQISSHVRRVLSADEGRALVHPHRAVEPGWHAPTVVADDLESQRRALAGRHPDWSAAAFQARVQTTFLALQKAWSDGRWDDARPYTTDTSWSTLRFWMEKYKRAGLRNHLAHVQIERAELTRITLDAWYESITVRIWASAHDWTEDARSGAVLGGSKDEPRRFSEYWTFLRAVGAKSHSDDASRCPSCGAPLDKINAAGACGYCGSVITTGAFDWVLTRIDQAEGYQG